MTGGVNVVEVLRRTADVLETDIDDDLADADAVVLCALADALIAVREDGIVCMRTSPPFERRPTIAPVGGCECPDCNLARLLSAGETERTET